MSTDEKMTAPRAWWILGDKCFPDGPIVPDKYRISGLRVVEHAALDAALKEVERLKKEDDRNGARIHLQSQTMAELEQKLAAAEAELKILKNPSDGRCMEIAALREENARLNRECISLFLHDCRMKEVEAKLALAVEALDVIVSQFEDMQGSDDIREHWHRLACETLEKINE